MVVIVGDWWCWLCRLSLGRQADAPGTWSHCRRQLLYWSQAEHWTLVWSRELWTAKSRCCKSTLHRRYSDLHLSDSVVIICVMKTFVISCKILSVLLATVTFILLTLLVLCEEEHWVCKDIFPLSLIGLAAFVFVKVVHFIWMNE